MYVSHSIDSVRDVCDHALWIDHGHQMMSGEVIPVTQAYMEKLS